MSDELVKRLRDLADRFGKCRDSDTMQEAVDRIQDLIQALQAQNLRLSGMVYDLKKEVAVGEAEASFARLERAEKAEAERDRLREALQQFLIEYDEVDLANAEPSSLTAAVLSARAALKGETP